MIRKKEKETKQEKEKRSPNEKKKNQNKTKENEQKRIKVNNDLIDLLALDFRAVIGFEAIMYSVIDECFL